MCIFGVSNIASKLFEYSSCTRLDTNVNVCGIYGYPKHPCRAAVEQFQAFEAQKSEKSFIVLIIGHRTTSERGVKLPPISLEMT